MSGGRYWVRTSDLFGVNEARYHCANRPRGTTIAESVAHVISAPGWSWGCTRLGLRRGFDLGMVVVAPPAGTTGQAHADVAQLVEHHLAKVRVAGSNPVVRSEKVSRSTARPALAGGVAERRGNGLQIRVHGFKSRLHLGRLAQW